MPEPAVNSPGVSPGGEWVLSMVPEEGDNLSGMEAWPTAGGAPIQICHACSLRWPRDGRALFVSFAPGNGMGNALTFVVPLPPGKLFPALPVSGWQSPEEIRKMPGVRTIPRLDVFPGPTAAIYAFGNSVVHRNIYRVMLPPQSGQ